MTLLLAAFALVTAHPASWLAIALGLGLVGMAITNHPTPLVPGSSPDSTTILGQGNNLPEQYQVVTTAGAITGGGGGLSAATGAVTAPVVGKVIVNGAVALALTLATPAAGDPSAGGNDAFKLTVLNVDGHQHTVATAANKINGNKATFTFAATVGSKAEFFAFNGVWYINPAAADGALT